MFKTITCVFIRIFFCASVHVTPSLMTLFNDNLFKKNKNFLVAKENHLFSKTVSPPSMVSCFCQFSLPRKSEWSTQMPQLDASRPKLSSFSSSAKTETLLWLVKRVFRMLMRSVTSSTGISSLTTAIVIWAWSVSETSSQTTICGAIHSHLSFWIQMSSRNCYEKWLQLRFTYGIQIWLEKTVSQLTRTFSSSCPNPSCFYFWLV